MNLTKVGLVFLALCCCVLLLKLISSRKACVLPVELSKKLVQAKSCVCPVPVCRSDSSSTNTPSTPKPAGPQLSPFLQRYASRVFLPRGVDRDREKYTLVIQTYRRVAVLVKLLNHYCNLARLEKILLLWNDVGTPVSSALRELKCAVPLFIIEEKQNKMTNRFKPRPEISTDGQ